MTPSEITVVTSLVDLAKHEGTTRRDSNWYLDRCDGVLSTRHGLVVFTEPELVTLMLAKRQGLAPDAPTLVIGLPFDELPHARDVASITRAFDAGRRPPTASNPLKDTPAYLAFGWSKPGLLALAARENPFRSRAFWWSDIGLFEVARPLPDQTFDELLDSEKSHLHANVLWETDESEYLGATEFYSTTPFSKVAGGLFGVSATHALTFAQDFALETARCLDTGWPTIDEVILGVVVDRHRDGASVSYGPWQSLLSNFSELREAIWHRLRLLRDCNERGLTARAAVHLESLERARVSNHAMFRDEDLFEIDEFRTQFRRRTLSEPVAETSANSPDSIARQ